MGENNELYSESDISQKSSSKKKRDEKMLYKIAIERSKKYQNMK